MHVRDGKRAGDVIAPFVRWRRSPHTRESVDINELIQDVVGFYSRLKFEEKT